MRIVSDMFYIGTLQKIPILGIHGFEARAEFHTMPAQSLANMPVPKFGRETCSLNTLGVTYPVAFCVYGYIYFVVKYELEDPKCDDTSRDTKIIG